MASGDDPGNRKSGERPRSGGFSFDNLFGLTGLAGQTFAKAVGQSGNLIDALLRAPEQMEQIGRAGSYLKDLRQVAGLTLEDLARAVDVDNPEILRAIEEGRSPVTLDILYRLASFYSRNDPITFMFNFSREYAPWLWQILRITGIEKLMITVERELKFINIYRSRESARRLSDEDFDKMLGFVRSGFNMAMDFIEPLEEERRPPSKQGKANQAQPKGPAKTAAKTAKAPPAKGKARSAGSGKRTATAKKAAPRKAPAKKTAPRNSGRTKNTRGSR